MPAEPYLLRLGRRLTTGLADLPAEIPRGTRRSSCRGRMPTEAFPARRGLGPVLHGIRRAVAGGPRTSSRRRLPAHRRVSAVVPAHAGDGDRSGELAVLCAGRAGRRRESTCFADFDRAVARSAGRNCSRAFGRKDGGYAKTHEGAAGSTYHSFLVALCYELIGKSRSSRRRNSCSSFSTASATTAGSSKSHR